jgi:hypothetical protein
MCLTEDTQRIACQTVREGIAAKILAHVKIEENASDISANLLDNEIL